MTEREDAAQLQREENLFRVGRLREEHGFDTGRPFPSSRPCPTCGGFDGLLREVNGQNTVRCRECFTHIYNAAKTETGESPRTVRTMRQGVKPSQHARIFDRDLRRCVLCGTGEPPLTLGHLLSVEDGVRLGATAADLASDSNLAVMCEACNSGLSHRSVSPRSYAAIMFRLVIAERERLRGEDHVRQRPQSAAQVRRTTPDDVVSLFESGSS